MCGREPFEQRHGLPADLRRLRDPADEPEQPRERAQRVSLFQRVAEPPTILKGAPLCLDRLVELAGEEALVGAALEQLGPLLRRQAISKPQCTGVLRRSLTVRVCTRRPVAGCPTVPDDRLRVAGRLPRGGGGGGGGHRGGGGGGEDRPAGGGR